MATLDQFLYTIAPLFGSAGKGISDAIQGSRFNDAYRNTANATDLNQFTQQPLPSNIYSPEYLAALDKARSDKLTALQGVDASSKLAQFANNYQDVAGTVNPRFLADQQSRDELARSGVKFPDVSNNPVAAKGLQDFITKGQQADMLSTGFSDLNKTGRLSPDVASYIAIDKNLPGQFDNVTQGQKRIADQNEAGAKLGIEQTKQAQTQDKLAREQAALKVYNETPVNLKDPQSIADFKSKVMTAAGTIDIAEPLLKRFDTVNDPYSHLDEASLTLKALNGDKQAQAILDKEQARKLAIAQGQRTIIANTPSRNVTINGLTPEENDALSRAIDNGLDPYKVNSRTAKVYAQQEMKQPGRKWNELGAQAAFGRNAGVMNTKALLNTIDPLLNQLQDAGAILGNSSVPGYNRAANFLKEQTGSPDIVGFNNLRDSVVAEVERGLMGTGVLSDSKYQRELKNINSAQSLPQLKAAIANTRIVIRARLESIDKGPNTKVSQQPTTQPFNLDMNAIDAAIAAKRGQ